MPSWLSASLISSALMPVSRVGNASRSRSTPRFFFSSRRRHTRCGRYWSSDVCSSDLGSFEEEAQRRGLTVGHTVQFPSMAMRGEASTLVSLKAVDDAYPLRGSLRVANEPGNFERSEERRVGKECRSRGWRHRGRKYKR